MSLIDLDAGFGVGQYSFSSDGKLWAYSAAENIDAPTKGNVPIVLGEFPKTATTVVDTGTWAEVQLPMFSPDNTKIAYQKRSGYSGNVPQDQIWVYDIASRQKRGIGGGNPVRWIDNKTLLVQVYDNPEDIHARLALMDIETKQITPISE